MKKSVIAIVAFVGTVGLTGCAQVPVGVVSINGSEGYVVVPREKATFKTSLVGGTKVAPADAYYCKDGTCKWLPIAR